LSYAAFFKTSIFV